MITAAVDPDFDANGASVGTQFLIIAAGVYWGLRLRKRLGLPEPTPLRSARAKRWTYIVVGTVAAVALGLVTWAWGPEFPITLVIAMVAATTIVVGLEVLSTSAPAEERAPGEAPVLGQARAPEEERAPEEKQ